MSKVARVVGVAPVAIVVLPLLFIPTVLPVLVSVEAPLLLMPIVPAVAVMFVLVALVIPTVLPLFSVIAPLD